MHRTGVVSQRLVLQVVHLERLVASCVSALRIFAIISSCALCTIRANYPVQTGTNLVVKTQNLVISRCCFVEYGKEMHGNSCCPCSTRIFPFLTNMILLLCGVVFFALLSERTGNVGHVTFLAVSPFLRRREYFML